MPAHGRAPWLRPDDLSGDARNLYERIRSGPRSTSSPVPLDDDEGHLEGPFNVMLLAPRVGDPLQALGVALRHATALPVRAREIAILTVAVTQEAAFEWYAHTHIGAAVGLSVDDLRAIADRQPGPSFDETERLVQQATIDLLDRRDLDDEAFRTLHAALGDAQLVELPVLVGYYDLLALLMQVWRTPLPATGTPVVSLHGGRA